jgi:hypothetical protein
MLRERMQTKQTIKKSALSFHVKSRLAHIAESWVCSCVRCLTVLHNPGHSSLHEIHLKQNMRQWGIECSLKPLLTQ